MNIGIDIDGVLVDMGKFLMDYGTKYFYEKYNLSIVNPCAYTVEEVFGCTQKQGRRFWRDYGWKYWILQPCMHNSSKIISHLYKEGHKVYIITSRVFTADRGVLPSISRGLLKYWLKKNKIKYEEITYCAEENSAKDKLEACFEYDIRVMVDDTPKNLQLLKDRLYTICFTAPWNMSVSDENIHRADNWEEVYKLISAYSATYTEYD